MVDFSFENIFTKEEHIQSFVHIHCDVIVIIPETTLFNINIRF